MARLTKIHVNLISNALRKRSAKVPYNPNWQKIFSELEVGSLDESARSLLFSKAQLHQLNEMSAAYFGGELLTTSFEGTRAEVAQHSRFEKLATITPDEQYVLIKPQPFYTGISAECSLRVPLGEITKLLESQAQTMTHIVIVENLDVFDCWDGFSVEAALKHALVVYRGHNSLAKGVKGLLQRLPNRIEVVAFVDVDPAGIQIALTTPNVTQILAPDIQELSLIIKSSSSSEDFDMQHQQVKYMQQHQDGWQVIQQFIIQQKISIKQQHLLAFKLPLIMHNRTSKYKPSTS
ncbi:hypothetical protein FM037_23595 [Shewanella psychropiezotolerans]|uniref:DUF7281 domain-containing protein n=1 Tax=Shewanella psychropiezotolerans TaxID=2593655 RepID=A0ABX5X2W7_9GAMM|nr:hypothetical protein [Shewanella psychropiezotolerans]QDO85700.1 hypothetical protein FM037_23595 [Shewanella psychropiezotolerans]